MPKGIYQRTSNNGFQKGHKFFKGGEKGWFKKGHKISDEQRKKQSERMKGKRLSEMTDEIRKKISEAHKKRGTIPPSREGSKISDKQKEKISKALKGKKTWNTGLTKEKDERVKKIAEKNTGKKLTFEQKKKIGDAHRGEKSHRWKGGTTAFGLIIRGCFQYRQWRSDVFTRDNFTCQHCGDNKGGNLEAHHIKEFKKILKENNIRTFEESLLCEELWNINNGLTLCRECHRKLSRKI